MPSRSNTVARSSDVATRMEELLDRRAKGMESHLLVSGAVRMGVKTTSRNKMATALALAMFLSVYANRVAASTWHATPDTSSRFSGGPEIPAPRESEGDPASSAALHLSGGGGVRVVTREMKRKAVARRFPPRPGPSSSAKSAANTFVPPPPRYGPVFDSGIEHHHPYRFAIEQEQQHSNQAGASLGPSRPRVALNSQQETPLINVVDQHEKPQSADSASQTQRLSREALVFMGLLALQFGVQPLLVRKFTPHGICKSSVVLTQELIKFAIASAVYLSGTSKEQRKQDTAGWSVKSWLAVAAIPAALYTVQNLASLLAYQNLEALTFNVLNQTKILSAAVCCFLVMGKRQSRMQILSLLLLSGSALVIERIVTLDSFRLALGPTGGSGGLLSMISSALGSLGSIGNSKRVTHGILPVLIASFISGLAGALTQKNLQGASKSDNEKKAPRNAYLFSMEMNAASAIILVASLLFSSDGKNIMQSGFFHQWTPKTFVPIITNSLGGIVVGLVTKHAGSVQKGFALIFGLLLSGLIQAGSAGVSVEQIVGGALAAVSLWLHTTHPYKPRANSL